MSEIYIKKKKFFKGLFQIQVIANNSQDIGEVTKRALLGRHHDIMTPHDQC